MSAADSDGEIRIPWQDLFRRIDGFVAGRDNHLVIEREVVPIIFVPGFLGSRLRTADPDERTGKVVKVWDPDRRRFMSLAYSVATRPGNFRQKLRDRKTLLLGGDQYFPGRLVPYTDENAHNWRHLPSHHFPGAVARGWGGVAWAYYGPLLKALQSHAEPVAEPVRHCFEFPVHAFGYDWTQPAEVTAEALVDYVRQTVASYRADRSGGHKRGRACDHVVFVTHSMGGLVAREAMRVLGDDEVLGAVHCGQPVTGTPSAYWRMKAGVERPPGVPARKLDWLVNPLRAIDDQFAVSGRVVAWVLGPYGEAVTSLLGNMPGALTLLPSDGYRDAQGRSAWLRYPGADGRERALPIKSVYDDVYLEEERFYRLIEKEWLVLADPESEDSPQLTARLMNRAWTQYVSFLATARAFHDRLGTATQHPLTVQIFAWGQVTIDQVRYTRALDATYWDSVKRVALSTARSPLGKELSQGAGGVLQEEAKEVVTSFGQDLVFDPSATTALLRRARTFFPDLIDGLLDEASPNYARLAGYRVHVDADDKPTDLERAFRTAERDGEPTRVYLVELRTSNDAEATHGDGTVALSSARALAAWRDVPITPADELKARSAHNELYQTDTVQRATARAVQNMCFRRIALVARDLPAPPSPPQPPAPPEPPARPRSRQRADGTWTAADYPLSRRIPQRPQEPVQGLSGPSTHEDIRWRTPDPDADADPAVDRPFEGYGDAFGDEE